MTRVNLLSQSLCGLQLPASTDLMLRCRFKSRWAAWTQRTYDSRDYSAEFIAALASVQFLLPPFHKWAHQPSCQQANNAMSAVGAGIPKGEPPEIAWAWLGGYGATTQYMSRVHRQGFLEHAFANYQRHCSDRIAPLLANWHDLSEHQVRSAARRTSQHLRHVLGDERSISLSLSLSLSAQTSINRCACARLFCDAATVSPPRSAHEHPFAPSGIVPCPTQRAHAVGS